MDSLSVLHLKCAYSMIQAKHVEHNIYDVWSVSIVGCEQKPIWQVWKKDNKRKKERKKQSFYFIQNVHSLNLLLYVHRAHCKCWTRWHSENSTNKNNFDGFCLEWKKICQRWNVHGT